MKTLPEGLVGVSGIQVACAVMDRLIRHNKLADFVPYANGFDSILSHPTAERARKALVNMRRLKFNLTTEVAVRTMAEDDAEKTQRDGVEGPYEIDLDDPAMKFRLRLGQGPTVDGIVEAITGTLPDKPLDAGTADAGKSMEIPARDGGTVRIDLGGLSPRRVAHDSEPRGRPDPVAVTFEEMVATAREMDAEDKRNERSSGWVARLAQETGERKIDILGRDGERLADTGTIELDDLRHVIGLPGVGKSTTIDILTVLLTRRGRRIGIMVPSILVAEDVISRLRRYGVDAALLTGISEDTRLRHADNHAEQVTARFGHGGLGARLEHSGNHALGCALHGFVESEAEAARLEPNSPPCSSISQGKSSSLLCPLSSVCGRQSAPRSLVDAQVWVGHVKSLESHVPPNFSDVKITYGELAARILDVVFVDEADAAQANADGEGLNSIPVSGAAGSSVTKALNRTASSVNGGDYDFMDPAKQRFASVSIDLMRILGQAAHLAQSIARDFAHHPLADMMGRLVTTDTAMWAMMDKAGITVGDTERKMLRNARREFDEEYRRAYFDNPDAEDEEAREETPLFRAVRQRLYAQNQNQEEKALTTIIDALMPMLPPGINREVARPFIRMSCIVMACTVAYDSFAARHAALVARGLDVDQVMPRGSILADVATMIPESIVGSLSGLRFSVLSSDGKTGTTKVEFVSFGGTPRLFIHRLADGFGEDRAPHTVLLSATSAMASSPSYDIPVGPHTVLRRTVGQGKPLRLKLKFEPVFDSVRGGSPIRISGSGEMRVRNLHTMIATLSRGERPKLVSHVGPLAAGRKTAIVVNSYDQVDIVLDAIHSTNPELRKRTMGIVRRVDVDHPHTKGFRTTAEVESLGAAHADWDVLVFPMASLGRGTNIVFPQDHPLANKAVLGAMLFPIRPHPQVDDLGFVAGTVGRAGMEFDLDTRATLDPSLDVSGVGRVFRETRLQTLSKVKAILSLRGSPLSMGPQEIITAFASDLLVPLNQAIGRATRGGSDAIAVFLDAAWAPYSADGKADTQRSSLLLAMEGVLDKIIREGTPAIREVNQGLYGALLEGLKACDNVRRPSTGNPAPDIEEEHYEDYDL